MYNTKVLTALLSICFPLRCIPIVGAQTPPNFTPDISNHLDVVYGSLNESPAGVSLQGSDVMNAPSLSISSSKYTSYVVIMLDFSVQNNGTNTTLLHWLLPGLSGISTLTSNKTEIAPYFPPGPPAGQTHTYGLFLYKETPNFAVPADYVPFFNNLTASVSNRVGFNLTKFVGESGLGIPVAADWFLVGMPNTTTTSTGPSGTGFLKPSGTGVGGYVSPTAGSFNGSYIQASDAIILGSAPMVGALMGLIGLTVNIL